MDDARGGSYGGSLLVALGWYATIIGAYVVGSLSVPWRPSTDCTAMFSCVSPATGLLLVGMVLGLPVLGGLTVVTAVVTVPIARRVRSVLLAGTASAAASAAVSAVLGAVYVVYLGLR
jgi:hypothetical protein